jgi:pimeloyl-ACP methyl ester carboxylesterase
MVNVRRSYADVSTGQIHFRSAAPEQESLAAPLLMLHMSPASGLIYEQLMGVLGNTRWCIAPDTPGYGNSDAPHQVPTIETYADLMIELLDSLGIKEPVDLMGYHTGSMTSVSLADRYPTRIRKLILVSAPIFDELDLERFAQVYSEDPLWTENGERLLALWQWFVGFFKVGEVNTVAQAGRIFYERLSGRENYWWGHHAAFEFDLKSAIMRVQHPTLVLNPADDLPEFTRRAEPLIRNGSIQEHPEWTHGFLDSHTQAAAGVILNYLNS